MIKPTVYSNLPKQDDNYPVFHLAQIAVEDTILGGARALVLARRAQRIGLPKAQDFLAAVSDVYGSSTGRVPEHLHPWECGECGQVYAASEDAGRCCGTY